MKRNIVLTGFMASGKTSVGKRLAQRLGLPFIDTDEEIRRGAGVEITEIFSTLGEAHFRNLEAEVCADHAGCGPKVIAVGGGAMNDPENRRALAAEGLCFNLKCNPAETLKRAEDDTGRPLLQCNNPKEKIAELLEHREPSYASMPFHIDTSDGTVENVCDTIMRIAGAFPDDGEIRMVTTSDGGGYPIFIGSSVMGLIGDVLAHRNLGRKVAVVTDTTVRDLFLDEFLHTLLAAGFYPIPCVIPAGEDSKTLDQAAKLYERLIIGGLDRRGVVIALGGGVVGDIAGFVAATYMRGVQFVQCPTTLLAMVDSSVGGKTGVDLPQGKNLVGAFKQPMTVLADVWAFKTLPAAEISNGMAELVKHTLIGDAELWERIEHASGAPELNAALTGRSVEVKIKVVESDPYEKGARARLNLGHTIGHAVEKCSGYALSHGAAVAVGLAAAARISRRMGFCSDDLPDKVEAVLVKLGLPITHANNVDELIAALAADKKTTAGQARFVLIRGPGSVEHGCVVPEAIIREMLEVTKARD